MIINFMFEPEEKQPFDSEMFLTESDIVFDPESILPEPIENFQIESVKPLTKFEKQEQNFLLVLTANDLKTKIKSSFINMHIDNKVLELKITNLDFDIALGLINQFIVKEIKLYSIKYKDSEIKFSKKQFFLEKVFYEEQEDNLILNLFFKL